MSDVKWIKIATDIFDDEKVLLIESLPSSDAIIIIWFKLLCLAGKKNNDGVFLLNDRIAYTDEMLATIFRKDINTVRLALKTFEDFGMIQIIDGVVTIPNWNKHQDLQKIKARNEYMKNYMANKRAEQKALICAKNSDVNTDVSKDVNNTVNSVVNTDVNTDVNVNNHVNEDINVSTNVKVNNDINKKVNVSNSLDKELADCLHGCKHDVSGAEEDNKDNKELDNKDIKERGEKRPKAAAFRPPTVEEVRDYCQERQNNVDPERFVNFYASKGWYVGKNKMKDWKAAVRNWEFIDNNKSRTAARNFLPQMMENEYDFDELEKKLLDN